jgi:hypothetical protein
MPRLPSWVRALRPRHEPSRPAPAAAIKAARPSTPPAEAAEEAELDTLRGELVRELDRLAAGDDSGSAAFRRIAS